MYCIYSGFSNSVDPSKFSGLCASKFLKIWMDNTKKYSEHEIRLFGPDRPDNNDINTITTYSDLGHIGEYLNGTKSGKWCGWTAGIIYGMIDAYVNNWDFVYKEQDCLWFGDCVGEMYRQIGTRSIIFGKSRLMEFAQSLFLVKRDFIPDIISSLAKHNDKDVLPERKFAEIPNGGTFDFGFDRDRPFNPKQFPFYIQQVTTEDFRILQKEELL